MGDVLKVSPCALRGIDTIVSKFPALGGLADLPKLPDSGGGLVTTAFKLNEMD